MSAAPSRRERSCCSSRTGSAVLSSFADQLSRHGLPRDQTLVIALLLNVALILFGWRRHRDSGHELQSPHRRRGARPAARLARPAHRLPQPPQPGRGRRGDVRPRASAAARRWRWSCSTSITSRRSTTCTAMPSAMRCSAPSPSEIAHFDAPIALTARLGGDDSPAASCSIPPSRHVDASPSAGQPRMAHRSRPTACASTSAARSASPARTSTAPGSTR